MNAESEAKIKVARAKKDNVGLVSSTYGDSIILQSTSPSPSPSPASSPSSNPPSTPIPSSTPTPSSTPQPTESSSPPPQEEGPLVLYAIVVGAVLGAVGVAAFLLRRRR